MFVTHLLTDEEMDWLVETAGVANLVAPERRHLLLAGLPREYVDGMRRQMIPLDQLRVDLQYLNRTVRLRSFVKLPMVVWLDNAARLAEPLPEASVFRSLREVALERSLRTPEPREFKSFRSRFLNRFLGKILSRLGMAAGEPTQRPRQAVVYSIRPSIAKMGQETVFTVIGENLPLTLAAWIHQGENLRWMKKTSSMAQFSVVPSWTTGSKAGVVKDRKDGRHLVDFQVHFFQ